MLSKVIHTLLISSMLMFSGIALAEDEEDIVLERSKLIQSMKDKEAKLKMQAEMSKHYKQMEDNGFFVDEDGNPLGITSISEMALDFRKNSKVGAPKSTDPFSAFGPVIPREAVFGNAPMPTLGEQAAQPTAAPASGSTDGNAQAEVDSFMLLKEIRANSILVETTSGTVEAKPGQKVGEFKLVRFDADRAYLVDPAGKSKVISFDWTTSSRGAGM